MGLHQPSLLEDLSERRQFLEHLSVAS
jgi:hypothetical protein